MTRYFILFAMLLTVWGCATHENLWDRANQVFENRWKKTSFELPPPVDTEWDFDESLKAAYVAGWNQAIKATKQYSSPPCAFYFIQDLQGYASQQGWDDAWAHLEKNFSEPMRRNIEDELWRKESMDPDELRSWEKYREVPLTEIPNWNVQFKAEWSRMVQEHGSGMNFVPNVYTGALKAAYIRGKEDSWLIGLKNYGQVTPLTNRISNLAAKAYADGYKYNMEMNQLVNDRLRQTHFENIKKSRSNNRLEATGDPLRGSPAPQP